MFLWKMNSASVLPFIKCLMVVCLSESWRTGHPFAQLFDGISCERMCRHPFESSFPKRKWEKVQKCHVHGFGVIACCIVCVSSCYSCAISSWRPGSFWSGFVAVKYIWFLESLWSEITVWSFLPSFLLPVPISPVFSFILKVVFFLVSSCCTSSFCCPPAFPRFWGFKV